MSADLHLYMQSRPHISQEARTGIDARMVAATRFILAFSSLFIIFINPIEPDQVLRETYALLVLYTLYSLFVFLAVQFGAELPWIVQRHAWWIDTVSYLILVSLSSGTNSIFFFFFFFAVLTAAFARGFSTGFAVVAVSAAGFWIVAFFTTPPEVGVDLSRFLLRPLSLLILGYMMSRWGGYENKSMRRLELLRQIGVVSNPRFGIDRTITVNLDLIRVFYDADACLFVMKDPVSDTLFAYHSAGIHSSQYPNTLRADSAVGTKLLSAPEDLAAICLRRRLRIPAPRKFRAFDCVTRRFVETDPTPFVYLFETFEARSLLTTPIYYRKQSVGRVFVYSTKANVFDVSDITFLLQTVDYFIPIVENIRLVDHMASDAAEQERKKIARDIHDSIIQPYIGLQIGIESLQHYTKKADNGKVIDEQLSARVDRLKQIADQGIDDLRNYVHGLTEVATRRAAFRDSLNRFAEKFAYGTGIKIEVNYEAGLAVRDRLAAEAFQIVAEALSNIRKHTDSDVVTIDLSSDDGRLLLEIANHHEGSYSPEFTPKSIAARAEALGGTVSVSRGSGFTSVGVSIPM